MRLYVTRNAVWTYYGNWRRCVLAAIISLFSKGGKVSTCLARRKKIRSRRNYLAALLPRSRRRNGGVMQDRPHRSVVDQVSRSVASCRVWYAFVVDSVSRFRGILCPRDCQREERYRFFTIQRITRLQELIRLKYMYHIIGNPWENLPSGAQKNANGKKTDRSQSIMLGLFLTKRITDLRLVNLLITFISLLVSLACNSR